MTKWLSVKELSEETSIPTSTIRRYIDKFQYFFIQKEDHRPKQYEAAAATVLLKIKQLYDEGCQAEEINEALQKEFSLTTSEDQAAVSLEEAEDKENTAEAADQQPTPPEQPVQPSPQQEPDTKQILQEKDKQLIQSLRKSLREQQAISELVEASKESSVVGKKRSILKRLFKRKKD
ncbi:MULTISPECIES: MerR family transcriptional regulator [Priestia]|jgi:DNA-binding transcriptional MerR regulator|uniref:MerR family transcriptional regulator n=1 Tax=Priestia TaxID=2800373 RepID=UPI000BED3A35|nr:MerR family transcriptional regulator [Priestia megaterium]MCF6797261.1 helix-turn-helix domain-containing protein [Bacillus sp. ET1]MCJ7985415.1 helix-turn-helix domain-containing protein [Priestia sp. OVL9]MDH2451640.1 MerR family transcriptional regulator [Priestia megaterium]MDL5151097.1 MerR family transcriptional regulator [Priestia megaterium]MED3815586.1 MerR family transcriptional regulator [Priestia megaterium]